ncbi:MAG TPA: helix-turn-helix transcriptional regulator [Allosphingosinicella sp.]|jgi:DNA-binding PadR family transcriptional regulator
MSRRRKPSKQTLKVLAALLSRPGEWRYGYDLTKALALQSGTLYPLLMRLSDEGLLESEWHPAARQGLPARHAYRLTAAGSAYARANLAAAEGSDGAGLAPA